MRNGDTDISIDGEAAPLDAGANNSPVVIVTAAHNFISAALISLLRQDYMEVGTDLHESEVIQYNITSKTVVWKLRNNKQVLR